MVVSPLLMELAVLPTVAAATSAMAAMLQFVLLGYLQMDYSVAFMAVGMCGGLIGQTGVAFAVSRYGRVSVVVFAVATVMALAVPLMSVNGVLSLVDGAVSFAFASPC